ncbi:unnamed protein product [Rhizophagus irregularis]|nr:unnamed protein product [Rhizophagus irregularis]
MYEKEYVDDLENGNRTYGENITCVAISPDGSIVATFNPYGSYISITKLTTDDKAKIPFDINKFKKPSKILGWTLAVSDIINTKYDTCLVAISCVTDKDINPKEIEEGDLRKLYKLFQIFIKKQLSFWDSQLFLILLFILYYAIATFIVTFIPNFKSSYDKSNLFFYLFFIIIPICILFYYEYVRTRKILVTDTKQFRLSCTSGEGIIKLFKFSFNNANDDHDGNDNSMYHHVGGYGGVLTFLKHSKNSLKNYATLICMNCVKIQKINIKLNRNISTSKEGCLNDYFSISKEDISLSDSNIPTPSRYDENYNILIKANGKVVFHNKENEDQFKVVHEIITKRTTFGEDDTVADEHEYKSYDLEPWNNSTKNVRGRFLNNDKRFFLIIGQNSIQLWKSKSINFVDVNNFKNFENSNLVYILISDKIKPETKTKFLIENDMNTVIILACLSL